MNARPNGRLATALRIALIGCLSFAPLAHATDYIITADNDAIAMDGLVSLAEAIQAANTNTAVNEAAAGEPDGDSITFDSGIGQVTLTAPLTISEDLVLTEGTISGNQATQLFIITAGAGEPVTFNGMNLQFALSAERGPVLEILEQQATVALNQTNIRDNVGTGTRTSSSSAIYNNGSLTITGGSFDGNSSAPADGDQMVSSSASGAVYSTGPVSATNTVFSRNSAANSGAAIYTAGPALTLDSVTVQDNSAGAGSGGGILISSPSSDPEQASVTTITNSTFSGNTAASRGGAIAHFEGVMNIVGTDFTENTTTDSFETGGGGALMNQAGTVTLSSVGFDQNTSGGSGGAILNRGGGTLTVNGGTIGFNSAALSGGGIADRSVGDRKREASRREAGGFTDLDTPGTININGVQVTGNTASLDGGGVYTVGPTTISIAGSRITAGSAGNSGGGIFNGSGPLQISNTFVDNNSANGDAADQGGGGIYNNGGAVSIRGEVDEFTGITTLIFNNTALGAAGSGGGIFNNEGTLDILQIEINENTANRAGGGIEDRATSRIPDAENPSVKLVNVLLGGNSAGVDTSSSTSKFDGTRSQSASPGDEQGGTFTFVDAGPTVTANPGNGGGLHVTGDINGVGGAYVSIRNSRFFSNSAASEGGGAWNANAPSVMDIDNTAFMINAALGATTTEGGGGLFNAGGIVNLVNGTSVARNSASGTDGAGGGVLSDGGILTITDSTVTENTSQGPGGGIELVNGVEATITDSAIEVNTAADLAGDGGGIHVSGGGLSTLTINRSIVANNTAVSNGGGLSNADGSTMRVWNSTIAANSAESFGGGGIYNEPGAITELLNTTVYSNAVAGGEGGEGGGIWNADDTVVLSASNTLIAENFAGSNRDLSGEIGSGDFNLIADSTGATLSGENNIIDVDAGLDDNGLGMNGGPTRTVALDRDSPAIDTGDNTVCTDDMSINSTDQRGDGFPRPTDGDGDGTDTCDIGAYEASGGPEPTVAGNGTSQGGGTETADAGATNVSGVGIGFTAPSEEALSVTSISGTLVGTGNFDADISAVRLYLDNNADGQFDMGDTELTDVTISIDDDARTWSATFSPARVVAADAAENYLLVVDFNTQLAAVSLPMLAGGGMLLLGLTGIAGFSRRKQLLIVGMVAGGALLTACGNNSPNRGTNPTSPSGPTSSTYQFIIDAVQAQGQSSGLGAAADGLPIEGPVITVSG